MNRNESKQDPIYQSKASEVFPHPQAERIRQSVLQKGKKAKNRTVVLNNCDLIYSPSKKTTNNHGTFLGCG